MMTRRTAEVRLDALLRTACDVIVARGLANTRAADVATAAGVSQALVFYHFETKDKLLARAFEYAAEQDLEKLEAVLRANTAPLEKLRRVLRLYAPTATNGKAWELWIDGWAESARVPELEKVTRRMDLRWREALTEVITAGVGTGEFTCPDPTAAAWRILALVDGLSVQATAHDRLLPRRQVGEWIRIAAAREIGVTPAQLT
jgi:AcrR family transcriptional regulator